MNLDFHQEIIISGFGGQGILFLGKFIALVSMDAGLHVTYIPSYGVEVRGGTANCTVICSKAAIASPLTAAPTAVFALNQPSVAKFCPRLRKGGLLIYNSSLVKTPPEKPDITAMPVPANDIAERAGDRRAANIVMLGAFLALVNLAPVENVGRLLSESFGGRKNLTGINMDCLMEGFRFGRDSGLSWEQSEISQP